MSIYVHQIRGVPTFSDLMAEFFAISNSTGAGSVLGENSFPPSRVGDAQQLRLFYDGAAETSDNAEVKSLLR
jgi:hypothetical protein